MSNFGIELLLESQKNNVRNANDVLVVVVHWILCQKGNLRNVGTGDSKIHNENDRPSELLPQGWNTDTSSYTLRYVLDKQIYILHASVMDGAVLFNLLDAKSLKAESIVLETAEWVKATEGITLDDFTKDGDVLIKRVYEDVVKPVINSKETQAERASSSNIPPVNPLAFNPNPLYPQRNFFDIDNPFNVGRADLDPLARGGGGMIFNPFQPHRPGGLGPLPPQRFPGPRYDPPNPFNRLDPNSDEFRPPGDNRYDDMFM